VDGHTNILTDMHRDTQADYADGWADRQTDGRQANRRTHELIDRRTNIQPYIRTDIQGHSRRLYILRHRLAERQTNRRAGR
jgi:hypothetical protein